MTPAPPCRACWWPGCPVNRCRTSWLSGCSSRWAWLIPASTCQAGQRHRFTSYYRTSPGGGLELADGPDGQWSSPPPFPLGNGGLASTADDWLAFGRMLLAGGVSASGRRLLSADSVRLMTTDHTTPAQREIGALFLEEGWGFGGSVNIAAIDPWNVPGRYGWVGGTGTSAHITPSTGTVAIVLTQVAADSPVPPDWMRDFWRYAAGAG